MCSIELAQLITEFVTSLLRQVASLLCFLGKLLIIKHHEALIIDMSLPTLSHLSNSAFNSINLSCHPRKVFDTLLKHEVIKLSFLSI